MSRNQALLRHFKDRQRLRELLARFPSIIEMFPPAERENWREYCGSIVELAEATLPPRAEIQSLIYRVIYFAEPPPDPLLVRKDKEAIGILFFRPHLFDFEIPILKLPELGVLSCPTPEWDLAHFILPVLTRWAPAHEMDFFEWRAWADFLLKRLEKETKLSIPVQGRWEEKVVSKESSDEVAVDYDVLAQEPVKKKQKHRWLAWREKIYIEGWDDILTECMELGLARVETEEDIGKIIEEAKIRWQEYSS